MGRGKGKGRAVTDGESAAAKAEDKPETQESDGMKKGKGKQKGKSPKGKGKGKRQESFMDKFNRSQADKRHAENVGKEKQEEKAKKPRLEAPDLTANVMPAFGLNGVVLTDFLAMRCALVRSSQMLLSVARARYVQMTSLFVTMLSFCGIGVMRMLSMHGLGAFRALGSVNEDAGVYAKIKELTSMCFVANSQYFLLDSIGKCTVEDSEVWATQYYAVLVPMSDELSAGTKDYNWNNTSADENVFRGSFRLRRILGWCQFLGPKMHPAFCHIIMVAFSYRASWEQLTHIIDNVFFYEDGPPVRTYRDNIDRFMTPLEQVYRRLLVPGALTDAQMECMQGFGSNHPSLSVYRERVRRAIDLSGFCDLTHGCGISDFSSDLTIPLSWALLPFDWPLSALDFGRVTSAIFI